MPPPATVTIPPVIVTTEEVPTARRVYVHELATPEAIVSMVSRLSEFMDIQWDSGPLVDDDGDLYYEAHHLIGVSPEDYFGWWCPAAQASH